MNKIFKQQIEEMKNWSYDKLEKTFIVLTMLEEKMKKDKTRKYSKENFEKLEYAKKIAKEYMLKTISKQK